MCCMKYRGTELAIAFVLAALAAYDPSLNCRWPVTLIADRSTMPQSCTGPAPPSSNADIDPTIANESLHASCVRARLVPESVAESFGSSLIVRPQAPFGYVALK